MGSHRLVTLTVSLLALAACGGKKPVAKPEPKAEVKPPPPPPETEADRAAKRHAQAIAIIPEGSSCLPASLKDDNAPRLELAAVGSDAVVCAIDTDRARLLGPIGCWKIDLSSGALSYQDPAPLPGYDLDVSLDGRCARGYCIPDDAKLAPTKVAHMAWSLDGTQVAVLVGDDVHLFDAASKAHQSTFSIRGDKGVTNDPIAIYFAGDSIFVEGADQGASSNVWQFKAADGSPVGPLVGMGKDQKPLSTYHGSFSILDKGHVGVAERGFETLTSFEVATGKRAKAVRKIAKMACKPDEVEAFWHDGDKVTDRCRDAIGKQFGPLIGANAVMGSKSLLVLLRDSRLGELAVMDAKSLAEKKVIKMPWCEDKGDAAGSAAPPAAEPAAAAPSKPSKPGKSDKKASAKDSSDPDEGGQ